ncbi:MAG: putative transport system permease protein, partial [Gaiellaceae bacterium]|nr:putative transport system permease protein [Gaiellaceae bacterium]
LAKLVGAGLVGLPGRTIVRVVSLGLAVALLAAMLLFVGHSLRTMTASATRAVPIDWQAPVASQTAARRGAAAVAKQPDVRAAAAVATASFAGVEHVSSAGLIRAGGGSLLAVPESYSTQFHTFRFLRGSMQQGEIVLDQQLAATLQVQPNDVISLRVRPGKRRVRFRVSGIALVTAPDVLFQPLNPLLGPAPAQPPANVAMLPLATFAASLSQRLGTVPANAGLPGEPTGVQWQVQGRVDRAALAGSPATAFKSATRIRNRVERSLPGQVVFVDNLAESLTNAAGDALYAETLYIMLALPGALVALGLAYLAALGTAESDRRDLTLLRARGARRRDLLALAVLESVAIGVPAGALGSGLALLAVHLTGTAGGIGAPRAVGTFGVCVALATAGAFTARIGAGIRVFRARVGETRPSQRPLWQRLYLDLAMLGAAGLIYWLTVRTGFSAVVNPDSNPTLSLSVYMFFAPALLWLGSALLLVRLRGGALAWLARRASGGRATSWRGFLLASAGRRGAAINRGLLVVGLLLAFGVNLGLFVATYDQQARIDAELTLGADVVVSAPPGAIGRDQLVSRVAHTSGVAGVSAVDHSFAYVGPDLQDMFGIDASTLTRGTTLRDSYFIGGSSAQMLERLRARRDGVLVSKETIGDYSLKLGDLLKLRILDHRDERFHVVRFHVVGVVQEFPAAPRDSFMVANLDYVHGVSHDAGPGVLFVNAKSDPSGVAHRVASDTRRFGTSVKDIRGQTAQTVSSITTVDLSGISQIEEAFVLALAAAAMALFVGVGLAERRRELATMAALGASLRQAAAFLWSEAAFVLAAGMALAALLGWLLAEMLVAMLQHVFDPPPDHLAAPWGFLGALGGAALLGGLVAAVVAATGIRRLRLGAILREE